MHFAHVNGVTLHYQLGQPAAGKPRLVFSNSLGTDLRIWDDVIARLEGEFTTLAYDKRGHGLSDIGTTPYTIWDHADDLAALIDKEQFGPAIICGISLGGLIAQALYVRRPDLVNGLMLCDTGHRIGDAKRWNDRIHQVETQGLESLADGSMERWFTAAYRKDNPAAVAGYRNMLVRLPVAGYNASLAAIRDADFTTYAPAIGVPTTCVVGEQDVGTPISLAQELSSLIPGSDVTVVPDANHLPCIERPETVCEAIRALSRRISG